MAGEFTQHQKQLITDYYSNLDAIMLNKLGEMVTELYLAETPAKQNRLWKRAQKAMTNLKIPPAIIEHIMEKEDVQTLAKNLNDWLKKTKK